MTCVNRLHGKCKGGAGGAPFATALRGMRQMMPCACMASATLTKPATFAPST